MASATTKVAAEGGAGMEKTNVKEQPPSVVTTTKTSEITIIMKTLVSNTTTTSVKSKKVGSKTGRQCECQEDRSSDDGKNGGVSSAIEVTTSVRGVFENNPNGCLTAQGGEPPILNKNFIALLKSANDSSFENVLEIKSLLSTPNLVLKSSTDQLLGSSDAEKDAEKDARKYLNDLSQLNASVCGKPNSKNVESSENNNTDSERSCLERNNLSVIEAVVESKHGLSSSDSDTTGNDSTFKKPKICDEMKLVRFTVNRVEEDPGESCKFLSLPSSTPIKVRIPSPEEVRKAEEYKLNLQTPPADASFIDSDFESMEQDQYDTCSSKESWKPDKITPPPEPPKFIEPFNPEELFPEPKAKPKPPEPQPETPKTLRKTSSTKSFFEEALKTPLALRKKFQKRRNSELPKQPSHSNLLSFFSSKKKSSSLEGVQKPILSKRSLTISDNSSADTSRCTSPALTEENVRRLSNAIRGADLSNKTLVWGENYDYSYECEPSHSDVEEEDEESADQPTPSRLVQFNISSPESSFEMQPPIVPTFKIDPPQAINIASELAHGLMGTAFAVASGCMKRSSSDPVYCKVRSHSCTPLTSDIGESDEDAVELEATMMKAAPHVQFHNINEASLRSLDKIAVSEQNPSTKDNKQINHNASPFRRWGQSSLRSRSGEQRTPGSSSHRRPSSLAASESDVYTKSIDDDYSSTKSGYNPYGDAASSVTTDSVPTSTTTGTVSVGPTGVASWGTSFEKLLEDAAGLHTFSEFLKKEFSGENIYFWTACEKYRHLTDREERAREAQAIFTKHLESGCSDPVNVDSIARNIAKENLPQAEQTLFAAAQKQIFNLMKFDSYQRFIKNDMYKVCLDAEAKGQPLPYPGELLDPLLKTSFTIQASTKLKKSLSNAEDRRRKSLLPWHRKTRCKSKDRGDQELKKDSGSGGKSGSLSNGGGSSNTLKVLSTNSTSDIHSSRSSLASFDAAIGKSSYEQDDTRNSLCRVILSNGATTVVQTRSNETIKELVERLLEKRGIVYNAYEAFLAGNHKPLDLDGPSSSLAGKEVNIDQRVVFKLSLPNRKMISVKSKATKPLGDVLRPILAKYNYELDQMNVYSKDAFLDMTYPVTSVDGLWLQVRNGSENDFHQDLTRTIASRSERTQQGGHGVAAPPLPVIATTTHQQIVSHFQQQLNYQQAQSGGLGANATSGNSASYINSNIGKKLATTHGGSQGYINNNNNHFKSKEDLKDDGSRHELNMLDEITNKVFNELMNGKIANGKVPDDCTSDSSSTRRGGAGDRFRRRGSNAPSDSGRGAKSKKCSTAGSEDGESVGNVATGSKKPIIAKLKAGVKLQIPTRSQNDELLEGLKRAQRSRLEDQRGTEINFELPDFLKDKENFTSATSTGAASSSGVSKFVRKPGKRPESAEYPSSTSIHPGAAALQTGSLQQINKPQPAPRLSITGSRGIAVESTPRTQGGSVVSSLGVVQSASSESCLNNLSMRCNASPSAGLVDDNGNGSLSENSFAETTMIFNHHQIPTNPCNTPESSPIRGALMNSHHRRSIDADCCRDIPDHALQSKGSHNYQQNHNHQQLTTSLGSGCSTTSSTTSNSSSNSSTSNYDGDNQKGPPPLPPKPKILPIKPSNWGHTGPSGGGSSSTNLSTSTLGNLSTTSSSTSPTGVRSNNGNGNSTTTSSSSQSVAKDRQTGSGKQTRNIYLDHASSSFV
ncbi:serine-rich adhesin for platelets-like isoform X1 [Uranotaenia lowii]|uniref:serine-rich adhesin for platelets-like isoform X1 n=1 Tax=Uranotaenia lowii TaxID=190385 RepID=UPI002478E6A4|nr:serine-rich adhesin for platelets-like isoform X1 [Uranotaenia lowii]